MDEEPKPFCESSNPFKKKKKRFLCQNGPDPGLPDGLFSNQKYQFG
jgi:hypothetical protein